MRQATLLLATIVWAHGVHSTRTVIEYISATGDLQITLTIPAAELEDYLRSTTRRQLELDRDPAAPQILQAEVKRWLQLEDRQGRPLVLKWIGFETKAQHVTCFLETKSPRLDGLRLRNLALLTWADGWTNQVIVRRDHKGAVFAHQFQTGKAAFAVIREAKP
jgi:hypothetical protein